MGLRIECERGNLIQVSKGNPTGEKLGDEYEADGSVDGRWQVAATSSRTTRPLQCFGLDPSSK